MRYAVALLTRIGLGSPGPDEDVFETRLAQMIATERPRLRLRQGPRPSLFRSRARRLAA
ncbi:hypothetical protein FALB51S_01474 [Frigidibacter albus]|uniref:Uncharacterized protein n=1 Tax=Frigidibacter mobilis TaxID=1335048 RepID=A0A159Z1A6_9RHOB|nr:hypothetical protein AKL17_0518 [Frigidibacter mobilis]